MKEALIHLLYPKESLINLIRPKDARIHLIHKYALIYLKEGLIPDLSEGGSYSLDGCSDSFDSPDSRNMRQNIEQTTTNGS